MPPDGKPLEVWVKVNETGRGRIWIGDLEVSNHVLKFEVSAECKTLTSVTLTLIGVKLDVEAKALVRSQDITLIPWPGSKEPLDAESTV